MLYKMELDRYRKETGKDADFPGLENFKHTGLARVPYHITDSALVLEDTASLHCPISSLESEPNEDCDRRSM